VQDRIVLLDGSYYAHRAHHAYPRLVADGEPTGALFGFAQALNQLDEALSPTRGAIVFAGATTFRAEEHPDYTGHRPLPPPELARQWAGLHTLAAAKGWSVVHCEGFEPLDVFARVLAECGGAEVVICGADKRYGALLGPHCRLFEPLEQTWLTAETIATEWGVAPARVADWIALCGQKSQGIPGVAGVGEKTAQALLAQFGDLEAVLSGAASITGKKGQVLQEQAPLARLSKRLATAEPSRVDLAVELARSAPRLVELRGLYVQWQFRALLQGLDTDSAADQERIDRSAYTAITTASALLEVAKALRAAGAFAVDLETTSLDPLQAEIVGYSFAWPGRAVYVPVRHRTAEGRVSPQLDPDEALGVLQPLLEDPSLGKVGQNLKYDSAVFTQAGVQLRGIVDDTMLADYLLEPEQTRHGLDDLALRHLGHRNITYSEVTGGRPEEISFADVDVAAATAYAAEDADVAWRLRERLRPMLTARGLLEVYQRVELPLIEVLASMERSGIGVDVQRLEGLATELAERIVQSEARVFALAGRPFQINSTRQLAEILFEERKLPHGKRTQSGWSTDADTLERLAELDPLPAEVLTYRGLTKLKSTYADTLPSFVSPVDGRIHTSFHQATAATGRLASNNPNLQNIPIRTEDGRRIRACFTARPGHSFVSLDYSQVELRVLAHYCQTGPLVESFQRGEDIHRRTASEIFSVPLDAVTSEQRRAAKAINFGIIYGMGPQRLAHDLRVSRAEATRYLEQYFARYDRVQAVQDELIARARRQGYAETLTGRKRPIPDIGAPQQRERAAAERIALNSPIQGSAADIIKLAMISAHGALRGFGKDAQLVLQVHDELLLEVRDERVAEVGAAVRHEMEAAFPLRVPLEVAVGVGRNWAEAHS
jgi:DNA polymerase-1